MKLDERNRRNHGHERPDQFPCPRPDGIVGAPTESSFRSHGPRSGGGYSNRPWQALFQSQREYRQHLAPIFDSVPNLLIEYDPIGQKVASLWKAGIRKIPKIAECLEVSEMTVRRRIESLRLKTHQQPDPDEQAPQGDAT